MKIKVETVYLGTAEKTSAKGNRYTLASFLVDGEPVSVMFDSAFKESLPIPLKECVLVLEFNVKYRDLKVIGVDK